MNEKEFRKKMDELDYSIAKLAGELGVSRSTIYRWFNDPGMTPLGMARQIISLLGLSMEETKAIFML